MPGPRLSAPPETACDVCAGLLVRDAPHAQGDAWEAVGVLTRGRARQPAAGSGPLRLVFAAGPGWLVHDLPGAVGGAAHASGWLLITDATSGEQEAAVAAACRGAPAEGGEGYAHLSAVVGRR